MEKPRKFFHHEKRDEVFNGQSYKVGYLHAGRVQVSVEAVVLLTIVLTVGLIITQVVLGFVTGWTVWWPFQTMGVAVGLFIVFTFLRWVVQFIVYLAGEITINGPETGEKS